MALTSNSNALHQGQKSIKSLNFTDVKLLLSESFDNWSKHRAPRLGASLAFYTLLSLTPLLLVVVAIVGLVYGQSTAQRQIIDQVGALVGSQGAKATEALLQGSQNKSHGITATVVGLVTLLFGASAVMIELRDALNTIWEVPTRNFSGFQMVTHYIKDRLFSFGMVLSIGFVLVVSLVLSTWIAALGALSSSILPGQEVLLHIANSAASFLVIAALFTAIYKVIPDVKLEWRDVILGGVVTSLLFTIGKLLLSLYLGKASIASSYGAFASIVVLVVWVYYSGQIFFLGAEFTRTFTLHFGSNPDLTGGNPGPDRQPTPGSKASGAVAR